MNPKKQPSLTVVNDVEATMEVMASEIEKIASFADSIASTRLTDKALMLLLSHHTGVPQKTCKAVLAGARELAKAYVKR